MGAGEVDGNGAVAAEVQGAMVGAEVGLVVVAAGGIVGVTDWKHRPPAIGGAADHEQVVASVARYAAGAAKDQKRAVGRDLGVNVKFGSVAEGKWLRLVDTLPPIKREAYRRLLPLVSMPVRYTVLSAAMLGFQMDKPGMLTSSGNRCGSLQPEAVRSTRQRLEMMPEIGWPGFGRVDSVSGTFGRVDWKTMKEPSGDIAGDESGHSPEKAASSGWPHCPLVRCDSRMTVHRAALRVKKSVLPSGEKVGEPSLAGPEITPGANTSGAGVETAGVASPYATAEISKYESTQQRLLADMMAPPGRSKNLP